MKINAVTYNSTIQKTNFGLMTNAARNKLTSYINKENSGMDEDAKIKLSYFEIAPDLILHYDNAFYLYSKEYRADSFAGLAVDNNIGDFLRKLFLEAKNLSDIEKTSARREKPITLADFNKL